mgnify:CR=1 FL=1
MQLLKTFETERLILKPTSADDAALILELLNTPKWKEFIGDRNVNNILEAAAYIMNKLVPQIEKLGFGNYTIIRKADGEKIGSCGLSSREGFEGVDIGFALLPAFENMGYAFEAAHKLKEAAFEEFHLSEISGITVKNNIASRHLLKKLGLKFEKVIEFPNATEEVHLYKLSQGNA